MKSMGALDGVRVLDFGRYIAGPYCAALLADLGADVIRVERVTGGEDRYVVPLAGEEGGAMFLQSNRNKRSLTLDVMRPEGAAVAHRLIATADVVVANLPPEGLVAMGLDYDTLKSSRGDIILTTVNAFGSGGPWSGRSGFDGIGQVMSGSTYLSGYPGDPIKCFAPWVDFGTGSLAALGTIAALRWRERTGAGQHVEAALLKTALVGTSGALIEQAVLESNRQPSGNCNQITGPADVFATTDGWIILQIVGDGLFRRWARLMGEEQWLTDPRFRDDQSRGDNGEILSERMSRWTATRTTQAALDELEAAKLPAGPVLRPQEVLDHPHVRAIGALRPTEYPGLATAAPLVEFPVAMSGSPAGIRFRAPTLGEHTNEILLEIGYGQDAIASLRADRIV